MSDLDIAYFDLETIGAYPDSRETGADHLRAAFVEISGRRTESRSRAGKGSVNVMISVPADMHAEWKAACRAQERTLSGQIRLVMQEWISTL